MPVRDIMTREVVTLRPEMRASEAARVLFHHRIHGAPVVDEEGRVVGVLSAMDLIGKSGETVGDLMTREVIAVQEDTPVTEAGTLMLQHRIRRLPVLRGDRLIGIVTITDVVNAFLQLVEE
jgi:CBS domain-containing protein